MSERFQLDLEVRVSLELFIQPPLISISVETGAIRILSFAMER